MINKPQRLALAAGVLLLAVATHAASPAEQLTDTQRKLLQTSNPLTALQPLPSFEQWLQQRNKLPRLPTPHFTADEPAINVFSERWAVYMEDLVVKRGYPMETHKVITKDGFILNMYRIPHGKYRNTRPGPRPVVLLQHGITLASNSFVLLNANESMAFILADAGFDVWMSNTRGNTYARGHLHLSESDPKYWRWSLDELALIDLPAQIDKALAVSGAKKLGFVGHSQGCTLAYMLLAAKASYNDKINVVVHVGPVVFIEYIRAPFQKGSSSKAVQSDQWLKNIALGEYLANRDLVVMSLPICGMGKNYSEWCTQQVNGIFYGPSVFAPPTDYWLVGTTWPASAGTRNLEHWAQMARDDKLRLQQYSYGNDCSNILRGDHGLRTFYETCNMAVYGSETPPEYDLGRITAPQVYMLGTIDIMAVPEDVLEQQKRLQPGVVRAQYVYERYSHMDFVWDRNAIYKKDLVDILYRFSTESF